MSNANNHTDWCDTPVEFQRNTIGKLKSKSLGNFNKNFTKISPLGNFAVFVKLVPYAFKNRGAGINRHQSCFMQCITPMDLCTSTCYVMFHSYKLINRKSETNGVEHRYVKKKKEKKGESKKLNSEMLAQMTDAWKCFQNILLLMS